MQNDPNMSQYLCVDLIHCNAEYGLIRIIILITLLPIHLMIIPIITTIITTTIVIILLNVISILISITTIIPN